jgi:histidinol-phosphate aminotransferase
MAVESTGVPEYIRKLVPYVPGKPIEETQRELGLKRVIKLASNENPLGPSPKALATLKKAAKDLHRYPDSGGFKLKQALSDHLSVSPESLILGNGSNEVIDFLIRTYCVPGDSVVTSEAAFIAYKICAQIHGVNTSEAPLSAELKFDLGKMTELTQSNPRVRMVFVANPNNPTGTYATKKELIRFLRDISAIRGGSVIVVLDYAYWEYVTASDLPDPMECMREFENVVVLRTFSKIYGLAGLRLGYGIARPQVIASLEKVRQPFNVNSLALLAGEAALSDRAFVTKARKQNQNGLKFWETTLKKRGIPFLKSQGNFILADVQTGLGESGPDCFQRCLKQGVIFRPVANYGLMNYLRISVGTNEENKIAAKALLSKKNGK